MTVLEKRKVERSNNILIVSFRQAKESHEYLLGITNNYSDKGINLETGHFEYNPGDLLELKLKHPYRELTIEAVGEIVWKIDGWYKNITGIKLKELDLEADNTMKDLMTNTIKAHVEPPSLLKDLDLSKEMEQDKIVVDETETKAEIIISHQNTSSISAEEVELPAEEKAEINIHHYREEKTPIKIIDIIGLLLIVFYVFFIIVSVTTRGIRSENDEKTQLSGPSQNTTVVQGLPSEHIEKAEKSNLSQNTGAIQGQPLLREEIIFDLDSDVISPIYRPGIDKFVKALLSEPDAMLKIEGYADSIGEELYNLDLAMRRAWGVKKLFMNEGINDKRIKVTVFGESNPVSSNNDESENPGDRRVTLFLVPSGTRI